MSERNHIRVVTITMMKTVAERLKKVQNKLKEKGFHYPKSFEETLKKVVDWYLKDENKKWLGS